MIDSFRDDYFFLSNFYEYEIEYEGMKYPSLEHAFQAAKTLIKSEKEFIQKQKSASQAKRLGKIVKLRPDWESVKLDIMRDLIMIKFSDLDLQNKLLATGKEQLIEGNTWGDKYWGVCDGIGKNWLGKLLMEVREKYRFKEG